MVGSRRESHTGGQLLVSKICHMRQKNNDPSSCQFSERSQWCEWAEAHSLLQNEMSKVACARALSLQLRQLLHEMHSIPALFWQSSGDGKDVTDEYSAACSHPFWKKRRLSLYGNSHTQSWSKKPNQSKSLRLLYCLDGWHLSLQHHRHIRDPAVVPDLWDHGGSAGVTGVNPKGTGRKGALLLDVYDDLTPKEKCTCRVRAHGGGWRDAACADVASRAGVGHNSSYNFEQWVNGDGG